MKVYIRLQLELVDNNNRLFTDHKLGIMDSYKRPDNQYKTTRTLVLEQSIISGTPRNDIINTRIPKS